MPNALDPEKEILRREKLRQAAKRQWERDGVAMAKVLRDASKTTKQRKKLAAARQALMNDPARKAEMFAKINATRKIPDFIHTEQNKIIELYGDYWHRGEDESERINHFAEHGFDAIVIWESEPMPQALQRITAFSAI